MMTILHTESSKGWGGQENRIYNELLWFKNQGQRVILLCQPDSILGHKAKEKGIEVIFLKQRKNYDIVAIYNILKIIQKKKVDIINTHSGRDSFLSGVAGRLSLRKPRIVRTRHLALEPTSLITYKTLPHKVITVSDYVRENLIKRGVPKEKIITIHTGISIERFNPKLVKEDIRNKLMIDSNTFLVGTVAIFRYKKGYHILLEAIPYILKKFPNTVFLFVGDGPQKKNILRKIEEMNLTKNVILTGLVDKVEVILKSIDIFVLPTLQEALGTSFLEAMAMEKPVVGTNVDGVKEIIKNGFNGFLVEPGDPVSLANAIVRILKNNTLAKSFGEEGRKIVLKHFSVESMCIKTYELYKEMLNLK